MPEKNATASLTDHARSADALNWCHRCLADTPTVYLRLSSGHIGNCCARCRATRKGKPFVSRSALQPSTPMPARAEGFHHARSFR